MTTSRENELELEIEKLKVLTNKLLDSVSELKEIIKTKADKSEIPNISNLATKEQVNELLTMYNKIEDKQWKFLKSLWPKAKSFSIRDGYNIDNDYKFIITSKQNYTYVLDVPANFQLNEIIQISNDGVVINADLVANSDGSYTVNINSTEEISYVKAITRKSVIPEI